VLAPFLGNAVDHSWELKLRSHYRPWEMQGVGVNAYDLRNAEAKFRVQRTLGLPNLLSTSCTCR
jgi:hypothetical protein